MTDRRIIAIGAPPTFRQQVARALQIEPDGVEWMPTVSAAAGMLTDGRPVPNVLVLSPAIKEPDAFGLAESVGRTSPATAILLVRDRAPNGILPAAMRAGVREVVDLSLGGEDFREALNRAVTWSQGIRSVRLDSSPGDSHHGKIVSVFSSKGGTGKSFVACNLAAALALETKQDVAVLDLDLELGDVFAYFGGEANRPVQDLLVLGDEPDREAVRSIGTQFGDHLWGFGSPHDPTAGQVGGGEMGRVVRALGASFDYVVIDCAPDYSDPVLSSFDLSDEILLIAGLDVVAVRHLSVALQTLLSLGFPRDRFRVVLNRADSKVGLSPEDIERVMKIRVDSMIPSSRLVPASLNVGRPIVWLEPKSEVTKSITKIAQSMTDLAPSPAPKRRLFARG